MITSDQVDKVVEYYSSCDRVTLACMLMNCSYSMAESALHFTESMSISQMVAEIINTQEGEKHGS